MTGVEAKGSPVDAAWAAFDTAALRLNALYRATDPYADTAAQRAERFELAMEVVRLWDTFRGLYLGESPSSGA